MDHHVIQDVNYPWFSGRLGRLGGLIALGIYLAGCQGLWPSGEDLPEEVRRLCGQQCLMNGAECSQFFARKNEERRQFFEQAKSNYWLCLKRFEGEPAAAGLSCVPPGSLTEQYDHCGPDLDACLLGCGISLEELSKNPAPHNARGGQEEAPEPSAESETGTHSSDNGSH